MSFFSGPAHELYLYAAALLGGGGFMFWLGIVRAGLHASTSASPDDAARGVSGPAASFAGQFGKARRWYVAAVGLLGMVTGVAFLISAILASAASGAPATLH